MSSFAGRRVVVIGLGVSGFAAARKLSELDAKVRVTESASGGVFEDRAAALAGLGIEVETGGHDLDRLDADLAVVSPGIAPSAPIMRALEERGVEVISEVELAYQIAECEFLAVTGTNGKTTTTALLADMLAGAGIPTAAAGNIGLPLVDAIATVGRGGAIALEVSSFQLASIKTFRPRVAVLLNVGEDHTDWHGSIDRYVAAKARIIENQRDDDVFMPNSEDPLAMRAAADAPARVAPFSALRAPRGGVGVEKGNIVWNGEVILPATDVPLPGRAGLEDAVAAAGAALEYGAGGTAVARALKAFRPLAHRLEVVARNGVTYIDDSKATNPHATLAAVEGLTDVVLIAGGRSKGIDLAALARAVPPVTAVVAIGEAAPEVERVFAPLVAVERARSMDEAVERATRLSKGKGSVLLSPGCASLDMYESYAQRGEDFVRAVGVVIGESDDMQGHDGN